ncbi:putative ribonuclease H protein [Drosera capensis]
MRGDGGEGYRSDISCFQYSAKIFLIPAGVIEEIGAILRVFLWSDVAVNRRKALVTWDKLCIPVPEDGLGFNSLRQWNIAFLFKQIWAVEKSKERLWVKWIHVYYIKGFLFGSTWPNLLVLRFGSEKTMSSSKHDYQAFRVVEVGLGGEDLVSRGLADEERERVMGKGA